MQSYQLQAVQSIVKFQYGNLLNNSSNLIDPSIEIKYLENPGDLSAPHSANYKFDEPHP